MRHVKPKPAANPKTASSETQVSHEALLAYAFRALGMRALTEAELRGRLLRRGAAEPELSWVIARVQELGYQQDQEIAEAEARRSDRGQYKVRQKLRQRGIAPELIEAVCETSDPQEEREHARALLERRKDSFARKKDPKRSALGFLIRRGFAGHLAHEVVEELF